MTPEPFPAHSPETSRETPASSTPPARILIVDDHPNTAAMLSRVLAKFDVTPVEIITACSAEEALDLIGLGNPALGRPTRVVDVLITDFMMAGMSGLDLIEKLKNEHKPAHTILITAYDTPGLKITAQRLKVNDYLVKPVQPEKIRDIVAKVLQELRPPAVSPENEQPSGSATALRPARILIADDNPDNIRLLAVRLQSEGYQFITAVDGQDTLDKLRSEQPDLLLLDVNMPRKDGFEVLLEMRADDAIAHIPTIIVTAARISAKDVRDGLTLGADDYVTKPLDWRELSARIRTKLRVKQAEDALRQRNTELGSLPALAQDLASVAAGLAQQSSPERISHEHADTESLTRAVLSRSVTALQAHIGHLAIFYPDGSFSHQMHSVLSTPLDLSTWTPEEVRHKFFNSGPASLALENRQGQIISNTAETPDWPALPNDPSLSAILYPLIGRQDVLGLLVLTHEAPNHFSPEHLHLLQAIASQAAIAIENAMLLANERKRVNELVALNRISNQLSGLTHSDALAEQLPVIIQQSLGYSTVILWDVIKADEGQPQLGQTLQVKLRKLSGDEHALRLSLLELAPQQAAQNGHPAMFTGRVDERTGDRFGVGIPPGQSVIAVPYRLDGQLAGVLSIHSPRIGAFQESDRVLLETLAAQVGGVMERIRLFETVENEHRRMEAVLRTSPDAILLLDDADSIVLANPTARLLFHVEESKASTLAPTAQGVVPNASSEALYSMPLSGALTSLPGSEPIIPLIKRARASREAARADHRWDDGRTFSTAVYPLQQGGHVVVMHDVSQFMALNQLKNEYIATASHDLKNPIFAVMGYSDLIAAVGPLNANQTDFLRRIRSSAYQMQDLVLNLLEMAHNELDTDLHTERVDMAKLLRSMHEEFRSQAENKHQTVNLNVPESALPVTIDRQRMQQVLRNLIGNAIKYTLDGGQVTLSGYQHADQVWVDVSDTGIGIPADELPKLFNKFYRVQTPETQDIQGNGLGLAIVKTIIEQHAGQIIVESEYGRGSTFKFYLPAAESNSLAQEAA